MNLVVILLARDNDQIALSAWTTPFLPAKDDTIKLNLTRIGRNEVVVSGLFLVIGRILQYSYTDRQHDSLAHIYVVPVNAEARVTTQHLTYEDRLIGYDLDEGYGVPTEE